MFDVAKDGSPLIYYSMAQTTQPGSNMSSSNWGGELSWHGPSHFPATPNVTVAVDRQKLHPMLHDKTVVASTGMLEMGYHTVNLTLNSGHLTLSLSAPGSITVTGDGWWGVTDRGTSRACSVMHLVPNSACLFVPYPLHACKVGVGDPSLGSGEGFPHYQGGTVLELQRTTARTCSRR